MTLKDYTVIELENELRERYTEEALAEEKEKKKPKQLEYIDCLYMREICQEYIDSIAEKGYVDEDMEHYIFETTMEAVYGKKVWEYINENLR